MTEIEKLRADIRRLADDIQRGSRGNISILNRLLELAMSPAERLAAEMYKAAWRSEPGGPPQAPMPVFDPERCREWVKAAEYVLSRYSEKVLPL